MATTNIIMAITLLIQQLSFMGSIRVGVNLGLNGDNLPSPADTISLFGKCHIDFIRIFDPNHEVLEALRGKPILLSLGVKNEDLQSLASDPSAADQWIKDNVSPYISDVNIGFITLGNEVIPGPQSQYVAGAINNTLTALNNAQIIKDIKVTTVVGSNALASSYPPSAGVFTDEAASAFRDIAPILSQRGSPIMLNVYPYFAYASDPEHISLDYALFTANQTIVSDGDYNYQNLFDAMVDSFVSAFEKVGAPEIAIVVSESGWPSAGNEPFTTIEMAKTYNRNLVDHVQGVIGTPRRRNQRFDVFLFEMFNENLKPAGTEQNFGFFNPNMEPVYLFWPC